jgi:hypothetical protein
MTISPKEKGFHDLSIPEEVDEFFGSIQFNNDQEIILDARGCIFCYDTGRLIIKILQSISLSDSVRQLAVLFDYKFLSENTMYEWLFRTSEFWEDFKDISETKNNILKKIKYKYNVELKLEGRK